MIYSFTATGKFPLLNIKSIGFSADKNTTQSSWGKRNEYIIHYVLKGEGTFNNNRVVAGQGFLITPDLRHQYAPDERNPWEYIWINTNHPDMLELFPVPSSPFAFNPDTYVFSSDV